MLTIVSLLSIFASLAGHAIAHGAPPSGAALLERRQFNMIVGQSLQKRCGSVLAKRKTSRMYRRNYDGLTGFSKRDTNDSVCLLTPEVTQGPYHILGELVRQNITQGQAGVPLELDVDFFDINTCTPVPNVWVDGWSANATGFYSGYEAASAEGHSGTLSLPPVPSPTGTGAYTDADDPNDKITDPPTDTDNFLRGVWQADESGHLTVYTIVPGWYSGRSVHFHIKVYTEGNGSIADNGTFVAGSALHTGQLFFEDDFMEKVGNTTPYNTNAIERVYNVDDIWYGYQNAEGYTANLDVALVDGNDITAGAVGSISVGLNLTYSSAELADFYWAGNSEGSSSLSASEKVSAA